MNQADLIRVFFEKELNASNVAVYVSSQSGCESRCAVTADISLSKVIQMAKERCMEVGFEGTQLSFEPTIATADIYKDINAKDIKSTFDLNNEVDDVQLQSLIDSIVGKDVPYDTVYKIRVITGINDDTAIDILKYILSSVACLKEEECNAVLARLNIASKVEVKSSFENRLNVAMKTLKVSDYNYNQYSKILSVKNYNKGDYEKLIKDLSPDFNAKLNNSGDGLIFEDIDEVKAGALKNISMEASAVRIAAVFVKEGKDAANKLYQDIIKERKLSIYESKNLSNRVSEIINDEGKLENTVKASTVVTSGFETHLNIALKTLKIDDHKYTNGLLEVSGLDKAGYEKLAKDLSPDFNAKYNGKGLVFEKLNESTGATLKNVDSEADAVRIASVFLKEGKDSANKLYQSVIKDKKLVLWESSALSNRVFEIIKEKGKL